MKAVIISLKISLNALWLLVYVFSFLPKTSRERLKMLIKTPCGNYYFYLVKTLYLG
jgi:hypothetical protein